MKLEYVAATRSVKISFTSKDEDNVDRALLKTHYSYLISGNNAYVLVSDETDYHKFIDCLKAVKAEMKWNARIHCAN